MYAAESRVSRRRALVSRRSRHSRRSSLPICAAPELALPYGGICATRGHGAIFLSMSRAWDTFEIVDQTFLATISPLLCLPRCTHVLGQPSELDFPILQTIRRDGRITEVPRSTGTPLRSECLSGGRSRTQRGDQGCSSCRRLARSAVVVGDHAGMVRDTPYETPYTHDHQTTTTEDA